MDYSCRTQRTAGWAYSRPVRAAAGDDPGAGAGGRQGRATGRAGGSAAPARRAGSDTGAWPGPMAGRGRYQGK